MPKSSELTPATIPSASKRCAFAGSVRSGGFGQISCFAVETVVVRNSVALRELAAERQGFVATCSLRSGRVRLAAAVVVTALSVVTIGGCAPTFTADGSMSSAKPVRQVDTISTAALPRPDRALLRRQPEPDCAFRGPVSSAEEMRQKLDYEQQCYRQAESIARARLEQLQDSVQEMIKVARQH